jgi:aminoglycoside phosphotransferase (APT) family kinase protein
MPDMTDPAREPGELIGRGRAADIYALDDGRVPRRYRTAHRCEAEAGLMRHLRQAGYPVPEVSGAEGPDIVMERAAGPTMHPSNVMLTPGGPVVIDWSNAGAGAPGADVAMTFLIMASSDADELPPHVRPAVGVLRRVFLRRFLAAVRDDHRPYVAPVAEVRIADPNVRPAEAARLRRLASDVSEHR